MSRSQICFVFLIEISSDNHCFLFNAYIHDCYSITNNTLWLRLFIKFRRVVIQRNCKINDTSPPVFRWYRNIHVFYLLRLIRTKKIICRVRSYDSIFQIFNLRRTRSRYQLHFRRLHSLNPAANICTSVRPAVGTFYTDLDSLRPHYSDPVNHVTHLPVKNTVAIKRGR